MTAASRPALIVDRTARLTMVETRYALSGTGTRSFRKRPARLSSPASVVCGTVQTGQRSDAHAAGNVPVWMAMNSKDLYGIVGVERSASAEEIKRAYRNLAHKYHPDVSSDPDGERKFKELSEAYRTLKLPEMRSAYDRSFVPNQAVDWAHLTHDAWVGWFLWMYWWKSWERAWLEATDTLR